MEIRLRIPKALEEVAKKFEIDLEALALESLIKELHLDPATEIEVHRELAKKFLEDGLKLIEADPVQASEKLYKAAEEALKVLVLKHELKEIIEKVEKRGRWKAEDFFEAVSMLRQVYGDDIRRLWSTAWELHVWGFHEAKATNKYVKERAEDVRKLVELALN